MTITAKYGEDISEQWNDDAHSPYMWYTSQSCTTGVGAAAAMEARDIERYGKKVNTVSIYYMGQGINTTGYTVELRRGKCLVVGI